MDVEHDIVLGGALYRDLGAGRRERGRDLPRKVFYSGGGYPVDGQSDGKAIIQATIRKLLAAGQQPHDQKITINVWGVSRRGSDRENIPARNIPSLYERAFMRL